MKTKPFSELKRKSPDTPENRIRSAQRRSAIETALTLGRLLDEGGCSLPEANDASRAERIDHEEDVYLSTLRGYVEMLGGELEINAVFPDQTVTLVPADTSG